MGDLYGESIDTKDPNFARLTDDSAILQQAVELCLSTQPGLYWSAPEYGGSLRRYLLAGLTEAQLAAIPHEVATALEVDERIGRADVTITGQGAKSLTLRIIVYPKGSTGQPYTFVASVTPDLVSVLLSGQSGG